MAQQQRKVKVFTGLTGRDGSTSADIAIPDNRAREMENVDLYRSPFGRKRLGCVSVLGETSDDEAVGIISSLIRHVPGADETAAELWKVSSTPLTERLAGGTAWTEPTFKDAIATRPQDVIGVSFNGYLILLYDSAEDRSHAWDGSTVRRLGVATPAAPSVANTGSGTYAATLRYYRVAYVELSGSTVIRRSLSSSATSFTPSGSGTHARITKPAAITEGETHWEIYVSVDGNLYFLLTTVAVGTTTYDDNSDPFSAIDGTAIPLDGAHTAPLSHKYGLVDGNRLLFAGRWESATHSSRVWFTPRLGSGDGDMERIPDTTEQENWVTLDERDGDFITGLGGPFEGMPIVFKYRHIWGLRPTGSLIAPYQPLIISKVVGSIRQQAVVMAEDENGRPAIYFLSHKGPYRFGISGLQPLYEDVQDIWNGEGGYDGVNLDATTVTAFGLYHSDIHQIWWWIAEVGSNSPTRIIKFDTRLGEPDEDNHVRGGWTTATGGIATARCATMFASTLGASMSRDLKPYIGSTSTATLLRGDTGLTDAGTEYAGSVTLPEQHLAGLSNYCRLQGAVVLGSAGPHTFNLRLQRDYGCEERTDTVSMAAETGNQTRTQKAFEAAFQADAKSVGVRIGDVCPTGHTWSLDAIVLHYEDRQGL